VHRLLADVVAHVGGDVTWQAGALDLLSALHRAGVPTALVTMSWRPLVDPVLAALPVGAFDVVVTGDEVDNGKPHPEPYLRAASMLRVDPTRCVAIEDSPSGAASAEAAGCAVLVVPHMVPVPDGPGRTSAASLEGIDVAALAALLHPQPA
jgi:HAD superfamily hydrolase (TIGR01509 family)